ncbi:MAG: hypothetical protein Q9213_007203 [Squamulea squamosa]
MAMAPSTGAQIIARSLRDLGVAVIFGIVGIPVNEQAAGYTAIVYGYLTGKPGVCFVVEGPGILQAVPIIGNSSDNAFPFLLLAGSSELHLTSKGAFQELDAISFLSPDTKTAPRPPALDAVPDAIRNAYCIAWYGCPRPSSVDFPADIIQDIESSSTALGRTSLV